MRCPHGSRLAWAFQPFYLVQCLVVCHIFLVSCLTSPRLGSACVRSQTKSLDCWITFPVPAITCCPNKSLAFSPTHFVAARSFSTSSSPPPFRVLAAPVSSQWSHSATHVSRLFSDIWKEDGTKVATKENTCNMWALNTRCDWHSFISYSFQCLNLSHRQTWTSMVDCEVRRCVCSNGALNCFSAVDRKNISEKMLRSLRAEERQNSSIENSTVLQRFASVQIPHVLFEQYIQVGRIQLTHQLKLFALLVMLVCAAR